MIVLCRTYMKGGVEVIHTKVYYREAWAWNQWHKLMERQSRRLVRAWMVKLDRGHKSLELTDYNRSHV